MNKRPRRKPGKPEGEAVVTIHDVAREAKVSIATVSRALNAEALVRGTTRERIDAAVKKLRYVPHSGARSLIMRETRTIGVLLPDIFGEFFSEVIRGLDDVARQQGYSLLVTCTHGDSRSAQAMLKAMHGRVDGLVVLSSDLGTQAFLRVLPSRTPVVFLNRVTGSNQYDSISVDNHGGAIAMTRYLLGLGHERIVFVTGPAENRDAEERLLGYREAMGAHSGHALECLETSGDFSEGSGYKAACSVLHLQPRPTAIFAANDAMAIGALCALKERGIRVPEEVSLAGFDDIPTIQYLSPPLSSVRTPISALGSNAAERLLARIAAAGAIKPRQQVLDVLLALRASTGSPDSEMKSEKSTHKDQLTSRAPPAKGQGKLDSSTTPPPTQDPRTRRTKS
jgi:LacI family transcriptional regulator